MAMSFRMIRRRGHWVGMGTAALLATVVAAGCGSSGSKTGSGSTSSAPPSTGAATGATRTYTVGILTDETGPAASSAKTTVQGVRAGAVVAARQGYDIKYVVGDTGTNPATTLSAAQSLVEKNHVGAVIAVSAVAFAATNYLTAQNIPVLGVAEDGPEWLTSSNMFSAFGPTDTTKVTTVDGQFFKMEGATDIGALGYSISPTSSESAKGAAASARDAGLKVGYLNAAFPFGSTNVQPVALAMKAAGVNGFTATVDPNTGLLLVTAMRQAGADVKAALLPTGYGGDLSQAGPGALQAAQNVYFTSQFEPVEMNTPATRQLQSALRSVGVTTDPTYAEYAGYASVALLVQALKATPNPSSTALINSLSGITSFDADGLLGSHPLNMSVRGDAALDTCSYFTKLSGSKFVLVPGADPLCGTVVAGQTVTPAS